MANFTDRRRALLKAFAGMVGASLFVLPAGAQPPTTGESPKDADAELIKLKLKSKQIDESMHDIWAATRSQDPVFAYADHEENKSELDGLAASRAVKWVRAQTPTDPKAHDKHMTLEEMFQVKAMADVLHEANGQPILESFVAGRSNLDLDELLKQLRVIYPTAVPANLTRKDRRAIWDCVLKTLGANPGATSTATNDMIRKIGWPKSVTDLLWAARNTFTRRNVYVTYCENHLPEKYYVLQKSSYRIMQAIETAESQHADLNRK